MHPNNKTCEKDFSTNPVRLDHSNGIRVGRALIKATEPYAAEDVAKSWWYVGSIFSLLIFTLIGATLLALTACKHEQEMNFNRIASYPVCQLIDSNCDTDAETAPEIVAATSDGMTLVFSDSPQERIGFVDISDPTSPAGIGTTDVGGEPTSVAVKGDFALVGVNTSFFAEDPAGPSDPDDEDGDLQASGSMKVVDIDSGAVVRALDVGGQPDSIAVSPDGNYVAIAIENERNEDHFTLGDDISENEQPPAGKLVIVDTSEADPTNWTSRDVDLTGLADVAPTDPEPEYVDINCNDILNIMA